MPLKRFYRMPQDDVPTREEVLHQLRRMLRAEELARSPQASRLLETLVVAALNDRTLTEYEIGMEALGLPKDWVPLENALVRQTKVNLQKRLLDLKRRTGNRDPVIIEVPEGPHRALYYYNPDASRVEASPLPSFGLSFFSAMEDYFGLTEEGPPRCVVTGSAGTWHHLDGNALNNAPGNLIPLAERFHVHLKAMRAGKKQSLLPELDPKRLADWIAPKCFANWENARAYGCAHLAFYLGEPPFGETPDDTRLLTLRDALYYARHCFSHDLLGYVLRHSLLPLLSSMDSINPLVAYRLSLELAGLASESGYLDQADQWLSFAAGSLERPFATYLDERAALHPFAQLRRKALLLATRNPTDKQFADLIKQAEEQADPGQNPALTLSVMKAARWLRLESPEAVKQAYEHLLPLVRTYRQLLRKDKLRLKAEGLSAANLADAFMFAAIAACRLQPKDWETFARDILEAGQALFDEGHLLTREVGDAIVSKVPHENPKARRVLDFSDNHIRPLAGKALEMDLRAILKCLSRLRLVPVD